MTGYIEAFLDTFKDAQSNTLEISNSQTWTHVDCFDAHWDVRL